MSEPISTSHHPQVTICVLTYGDYPALASQSIESILRFCDRSLYRLVVGANAVGDTTRTYLKNLYESGKIDRLYESDTNLNKCPMMRRMFEEIDTDYVWWFDDDSFIQEASALQRRLDWANEAPIDEVLWGHVFFFGHEQDFSYGTDVVGFVKKASWYRGLEPPSWAPGGKGVFNFEGKKCGDGRWFFVTGGNWWIRTQVIKQLNWPDPNLIKRNDDVFLSEAIRQQGRTFRDIGPAGVAINTQPRRGEGEDATTMELQMSRHQEQPDMEGWFFPEEAAVYRNLVSNVKGGTIVELGVWKGKSISEILDICRENKNELIAVDLWPASPDEDYYAEAYYKDIYQVFLHNLELLGHRDTVRIIREDTAHAATYFEDGSVDLVFIDADHSYEAVKRDLLAWIPKLRKGGVLLGHDYIWKEGVRTALEEVLPRKFKLVGGSLWQMLPTWEGPLPNSRGSIFLPTFQDTELLIENYANRPELSREIDIHVYDDNFNPGETARVKILCEENGWFFHHHERSPHGEWEDDFHDLQEFNRFVWDSLIALGEVYDFVIKMDTDAYIVEPDFYHEFAHLLTGKIAIAGTPEYRSIQDVMGFWSLAESYGYTYPTEDWIAHMQGGIYGLSKAALAMLKEMQFMEGRHAYFVEDGYISYCCLLQGIEYIEVNYSGSWWHPYRPSLDHLQHLKAIHPLSRSDWEAWKFPKTMNGNNLQIP